MIRAFRQASVLLALCVCGTARAAVADGSLSPIEPIEPLPRTLVLDPVRVALGEQLFSDRRLSADRSQSCADCHPIARGGMDGRPRAVRRGAGAPLRNTPTIFNVGFDLFLNWDGATESLPVHDGKVMASVALMGMTWTELLPRLRSDPDYVARFARRYPTGITADTVLDALAEYERSLYTPDARMDRYLRGERAALSADEQQGYRLFKSYGCIACHQGINIGGNLVQKFGVFEDTSAGRRPGDPIDLGRFNATHDAADREVFRVPSLRNVAVTAPYFHDGRAPTLAVAVRTMARVQLGRAISEDDVQKIVAFLGTLTGQYRGKPLVAGP
jgi:cytochrome c peroxidase